MAEIKEIQTNYGGSLANYQSVRRQIAERWSEEEACRYNPRTNCMSYRMWRSAGYFVLANQVALRSTVIITKRNKAGDIIARYPKKVALFYRLQVSPMN